MKGYFFDAHVTGLEPDGSPIYDRAYQAADHADFYKGFFVNGIFANDNPDAFKVTVEGAAIKSLRVAPGRMLINGYQGMTDGTDTFPTAGLEDGYYRVIIRLDKSEEVRGFSCNLVFGSTTDYPELIREGNIYDMGVADVTIKSGVPSAVTDTRAERDLCGFAAFTGQPAYQPPTDVPANVWDYAVFPESMTPEQRAIVENTPDLLEMVGKANTIPRGGIIMWSGSLTAVPTGWALCDGTNNTPDLRGKFIVGAGGTYAVGDKGGADSVALSVAQMPNHAHYRAGPSGSSYTYASSQSAANVPSLTTYPTSSAGSSASHENRPPYYALAYIMKL